MDIQTKIQNLPKYKITLEIKAAINHYFQNKGYLQIDLPVLSPALIPESYLEIFETEFRYLDMKKKLYLTPSPELFLKRLIGQGIGNCYYLGKTFRNSEPNSSLHLPEFTMLEFYKVGVGYKDLATEILELLRYIARCISGSAYSFIYQGEKISLARWEELTLAEAFARCSGISGSDLFVEDKFLQKAKTKGYNTSGFSYEDIFSQIIAQEIEPNLGKNGYPTMVYDFPPKMASLAKLSPDKKIAERMEFYIDGKEIGGCCTEADNWREYKSRIARHMKKRKEMGSINHKVDNEFVEAIKDGFPPCTGAGIGVDRLAMIFANAKSIGELKLIEVS